MELSAEGAAQKRGFGCLSIHMEIRVKSGSKLPHFKVASVMRKKSQTVMFATVNPGLLNTPVSLGS
jgi:hypothetical protein